MAEEVIVEEEKKPISKKGEKKPYVMAVGRRREAVARVRLYEDMKSGVVWGDEIVKKGEIYVNKKSIETYFPLETQRILYTLPLKTTNTLTRYAITIKVQGGGNSGQLEAVIHGLSRALQKADPAIRSVLKKKGFLTRDPRTRQRRKVGMGGKSRRKRQSPKR